MYLFYSSQLRKKKITKKSIYPTIIFWNFTYDSHII